MANKKVSELQETIYITDSDYMLIAQEGESKKIKANTFMLSDALSKDKISLIADVDGTDYKQGDIIDISFLISEQSKNYSHLIKNLHTKESVSIICRGDSLTYGYDVNSEDIIDASTELTDLGTSHSRTRAGKQYPQMLGEYLKQYGYDVSVTNLGYSGIWAKKSFDEYYKKRSDSLEFIMLGTNDSSLTSCPYVGDVKQFIDYYEQLIIREILFGNGLILIQPINTRNTTNLIMESFRTAVYLLGNKYKIPVIDGSDIIKHYNYTIWSDSIHLNSLGYSILGCAIASSIAVQDLTQPKQLFDGTILLTSPTIDSCCYVNENASYSVSSVGYTPDSTMKGGRSFCRLNTGGEIIYTFYNNVENLVLLPTIYLNANTRIRFQLNFGLPQSKTPLTTSNYQGISWDGTLPNGINLETAETSYSFSKTSANIDFIDNQPLILANKGFYSLRITNISATDDGSANLFGIECMSIESWYNLCNRSKYRILYNNTDGIGDVETVIELTESMNHFDVLSFNTYYFGLETNIVDFSTGSIQYIKHINLVDDGTDTADAKTAYNEIRLQKIDDYHIKITMNKSIIRNENGVSTVMNGTSYLSTIQKITGIKY